MLIKVFEKYQNIKKHNIQYFNTELNDRAQKLTKYTIIFLYFTILLSVIANGKLTFFCGCNRQRLMKLR